MTASPAPKKRWAPARAVDTTQGGPPEWEARFQAHERSLLSNAVPFAASLFLGMVMIGLLRHLVEVLPAGPVRPGMHLSVGLVLFAVVVVGRLYQGLIRPVALLGVMTVGVLSVLTIAAVKLGTGTSNSWFGLFLYVMTLSLCCPLSVAQVLATLAACWAAFFVAFASATTPLVAGDDGQMARMLMGSLLAFAATVVTSRLRRRQYFAGLALEDEQQRTRHLLLNVLPRPIADRLQGGEITIADAFDDVTVLFADIVGFTTYATDRSAGEVVEMLDGLFGEIDELAMKYGLEKIKTIGDCYMVAAGIPETREDHAEAVARFALEMVDVVAAFAVKNGSDLSVRIGLHSGPVVAGVIGKQKFAYDLWGDTVNLASRMESHGAPGRVHVSAEAAAKLEESFKLEARGAISVKGKGDLETFFVLEELATDSRLLKQRPDRFK